MKNKQEFPRLNTSEAIKEIQNRTGLPEYAIKTVLNNYIDILTECIFNEVEVVFGEIGYFSFKHYKEKKNVRCKNIHTRETYYMDIPPYNMLTFKLKDSWKSYMKKETSKLFMKGINNELG